MKVSWERVLSSFVPSTVPRAPVSEEQAIVAVPEVGFISEYIAYTTEVTTSPTIYQLGAAISTLAVTCPIEYGMRYAIELRPNLFTVAVGRSGEDQKSTALRHSNEILTLAAPSLLGHYPGSPAGLVDSLSDRNTQLIMMPELGKFLAETRSGQMEPVRTLLTDLWDSMPFERHRTKKAGKADVVRVANPRLSLLAACSVPLLEQYTTQTDWTGGFLGRWLFLYGRRTRLEAIPSFADPPERLVRHVALRCQIGKAGRCVGFTARGEALWRAWFAIMHSRPLPGHVKGMRTRIPALALKIALIYAWDFGPALQGEPWKMTPEILLPALQLAELHVQSVVAVSDSIAEHGDARMRREILGVWEIGESLTMGEVLGRCKRRPRIVKEIITGLVQEGLLRPAPPAWTRVG